MVEKKEKSPFEDIRKKLKNIRAQYAVSENDLLLQANYLDFEVKKSDPGSNVPKVIKMTHEIAMLYADALKTRGLDVIRDSTDLLPNELKLLTSGWLLHDMLTMDQFKIKTEQLPFPKKDSERISVSNASAQGTFAFLQRHRNSLGSTDCTITDFSKKNITTKKLEVAVANDSKCALSHDGKYLLIISLINLETSNCQITICDLEKKIAQGTIIKFEEIIKTSDVTGVLYNNSTQSFRVIVCRDSQTTNKFLGFYEINPKDMQLQAFTSTQSYGTKDPLFFVPFMNWSCIGQNLVGVYIPGDNNPRCAIDLMRNNFSRDDCL